MSTTIDERVVSLQFDNKQFEKDTATTMSTLDKLKQKLSFDKSSKGLEDVGNAAKKVDMSGLDRGVQSVTAKFSAMDVMAVTALANITNSAVNAGKRMIKALTLDPITTGFQEYETQINATQTILANTASKGSDINDVNKALEDLNAYADKTIYNFTEMTRNIGTFTAAGIDLDTSVNAIQGIANLAAVSGSTSQQASTAMYQLSQALSSGTVKLQDWNSVVNAGMGGEMFQTALRETSEELKTGAEAAIKAQGSFRESLKTGWLTADVLTATLKKFTTSGANEYVAKYTGLSQDAIESTLRNAEATAEAARAKGEEADAIDIAAESLAKMSGKNKEEIKNTLQFAKTAEDAATKVKTFTQLWDVLKESAQSGWTQTWKLIVGDFEEAKGLLTPLADFLTGIINKISDWRNRVLQIALDFAAPWEALRNKFAGISEVVSGVTGTLDYFQKVVDRVWMGDFNNWGDNPDRRDLLKAAGYDPRVVQYLVNLGEEAWHSGKKYKLSIEEVEAAHKKYGLTFTATTEKTTNTIEDFNRKTFESLKQSGKLTKDEIRLYEALTEEASKAGVTISELAKEMSETDGRTLLVESFKNVGKTIGEIAGAAKKALGDVFNIPSAEVLGIRLYGLLRSFNEFTKRVLEFTKTHADKIQNVFKGLFSIVKVISILVGGPLVLAFKVGLKVFTELGFCIAEVVLTVADAIVKFSEWILSLIDINKIAEFLAPLIGDIVDAIKDWFKQLKDSGSIQEIFANTLNLIKTIFATLKPVAEVTTKAIKGLITILKDSKVFDFVLKVLSKIFGLLQSGFSKSISYVTRGIESFSAWIETLKNSEDLPKDIAKGIAASFKRLLTDIKNFFKKIPQYISQCLSKGVDKISDNPIVGIATKIKNGIGIAVDVVVELGKMLVDSIKGFLSRAKFEEISKNSILGLIEGLKNGAGGAWDAAIDMVKNLVSKVCDALGIHSPSTVFLAIGGFIVAGLIGGIAGGLKGGSGDILQGFADFFAPVIEWLKNIDFGQIIAVAMSAGLALVVKKALDIVDKLASPMDSLGGLFETATEILAENAKNFSKVVVGFAKNLKAEAFKTRMEGFRIFVTSLVMLIAAIIVLTFFDPKKLLNSIIIVAALGLVLLGLMALMNLINKSSVTLDKGGLKMNGMLSGLVTLGVAILLMGITVKMLGKLNKEEALRGISMLTGVILGLITLYSVIGLLTKRDMGGFSGSLLKTAAAIAIMAIVVKMLGRMKTEKLQRGIIAITLLSGIIVGLMAATKLVGTAGNVGIIGTTLIGIAAAIAIMGLTVKMIGGMKTSKLNRGLQAITTFAAIIVGLMFATRLISTKSNVSKIGTAMIGIAVAIGVMGLAVRLIGGMDPAELARGEKAIGIFAAIIAGLMLATRLIGNGSNVIAIGGTLLSIAVAIGVMAGVVYTLSLLSDSALTRGLIAITGLSAIMVGLMASTKLLGGRKAIQNAGSCLIAVAGAIAILAAVAIILGFVPADNLAKGVIFVGILSTFMAGLIAATAATKNARNCQKTLILMAVIIALLGGLLIGMSFLNPDALLVASGALSAVIGVFSLLVYTMQYLQMVNWKKLIGPMAVLVVVVALLATVITVMANKLSNAAAVIPAATALSVLMLGLAGVIAILSVVSTLINTGASGILKGIGLLTLLLIPLAGAVLIINMMSGLENAMGIVKVLLGFVGGLTLLLIPLTVIGAFGLAAITGVGVLAALIAALTLVVLAFGGIVAIGGGGLITDGIAVMKELANGIADIITAFTTGISEAGLLKVLAVFLMMPLLVAGINLLLPLMLAIGAIAAAIGKITDWIPRLEEFLNIGIPILVKLAGGIGEMIGAFIGGIITQIVSTLPYLGLMLSQFMVNATPFINGAKMVDEKVLAGVAILAGAILALTVAELIAGVASFLQGGSSFADLGTQLSMFMMNAMPFIVGASMISEDMLTGVKMLAETILILTAANVVEGLTSWLTGGSSLEDFSKQLPKLGEGLAAFSASLGTFTEEQMTTVKFAAEAIKTLSAAAAEIPNTGGLLASIVGENDLGVFAKQFPVLGSGLRDFLTNVGEFSDDQIATIDCAASAVKTLAEAASEIPNMGGLLASIVGENDLGVFAAQFPVLGSGLRDFLTNVGEFSDDQVATVECAASAVKTLASAAAEIPNTGGLLASIVGDNGLGTFAAQFPMLGSGLRGFLKNAGTFGEDEAATITCAAGAVKALAEVAQNIPNEGGWLAKIVGDNDLSTFAEHFPDVGRGLRKFADKIGTFTPEHLASVEAGIKALEYISYLAGSDLDAISSDLGTFSNKLPKLGENLKSFCTSMPNEELVNTTQYAIDHLLASIRQIADVDTGVLKDFSKHLEKAADGAIDKFINAFTSETAKTDLKAAATALAAKAPEGAGDKKDAMESAGKDLGDGLISGINAKKGEAYWAGYALGQQAVQGEKDGQKSNSPSKLTIQSGKWLGQGLVIGIDKMGRAVYNSGYALGESAVKSTSSAISRIADAINTDIDAQPTIRPIMDLSDVRAGANTIGSLLNTESSIGVVANASRIGGMMSRYSQNGGNADVVAELNKLRSEIGNMGNTSYNINGITYDDGSNVRTAVETLVRAARIERRT